MPMELDQAFNDEIARFTAWCAELEAEVRAGGFVINRSRWYYGEALQAYVRCGWSFLPRGKVKSLVLANLTVEEERQGQGFFTALLNHLEQRSAGLDAEYLVIESVLNPRLAEALHKRGYRTRAEAELAPTLFKQRA